MTTDQPDGCDPAPEAADSRPDLDRLPPGALPASQLHRWRADALGELAEGVVPDGEWRVGGHCPRNLWIGPPRPYGVDVGRMDSPELAAFVVEAVNRAEQFRAALEHIATSSPGDRRDYARDVLAEASGPDGGR